VRVFVDTNVLVYAFDQRDPVKRARSLDLLGRHGQGLEITVSTQVLQELYVALVRKLKLSATDAQAVVEAVTDFTVTGVDVPAIREAMKRSQADSIAFWDALILESALASGCDRLLSEDFQTGRRFGELLVVNPFETDSSD
jgi:predicted nucleic acid-binding protein